MHHLPPIRFPAEGTWILFLAAITAAVMWLLVMGAWPQVPVVPGPLPAPAPGALPL
jgi:hypothetical protein